MSLYKKNLELIQKNASDCYNIITREEPFYKTRIEKVEGPLNYIVENAGARCFIHSIYSIDREMEEMFRHSDKNVETLIILGFGCGNVFNYISRYFTNLERVIIIEPDLKLFKEVMKHVDLYETMKNVKRTVLLLNRDCDAVFNLLVQILEGAIKGRVELVSHLSCRSLFKGYFEYLHSILIKHLQAFHINLSTEIYFLNMWALNIFKNIRHKSVPIDRLLDSLKGRPAIIVSAGPSLDKNVHLLSRAKDHAFIMAAGSAIKILDSKGIVPHLRIALEAFPDKSIFKDVDTESAPLIYGTILYHEILDEYKGEKVEMVVTPEHLTQYIYERSGCSYLDIKTSGSVTTAALQILCMAGCSKVIFMGQDMCYTEDRVYAKGSQLDGNNSVDYSDSVYFKTKDMYGQEVYTSKPFMAFKYSIEEVIKKNPGMDFINATEGGLKIEYTDTKKFAEVLEELTDAFNPGELVKQALDTFGDSMRHGLRRKISRGILEIDKELDEIIKINDERLEKLIELKENREKDMSTNELEMEYKNLYKYEERMLAIGVYRDAILKILNKLLLAARESFQYKGDDKRKHVESWEKFFLGQTTEIHRYTKLLKDLIEDYKASMVVS